MKAIVTVVGQDRVGIIAAVCSKLAEFNVNVLDISQTVMQGYFTMMMATSWAFRWGCPSGCSGKISSSPCTASEETPCWIKKTFCPPWT